MGMLEGDARAGGKGLLDVNGDVLLKIVTFIVTVVETRF